MDSNILNIHNNISNENGSIKTENTPLKDDNIMNIEKEPIISFDITHNNENKSYYYKKIGNTYTFFGDIDGNPLLLIGPQWPLYFFFSIITSIFIIFFIRTFWDKLNLFFKFMGILVYTTFIISYTYTFLINPGYPKQNKESKSGHPRNKYKYCNKCKIWVRNDNNTCHCPECNICIEGFDHHCPWTSKCVGNGNKNPFYIFLISTLLIFTFIISSMSYASSQRKSKKYKYNILI